MTPRPPRPPRSDLGRQTGLALAALGVVFGDIGTSPLYAMRESFEGHGHELAVTEANVLGVLSLVVWSLVLVVAVKYLGFVMRAANDGEGGILALTALLRPDGPAATGRRVLVLFGLFGTALLYGDGMITPAISVLGAVEGTEIATDRFEPYLVPLAVGILVALFSVQRRGTGAVGKVFGPAMALWFVVLGALGLRWVAKEPAVLEAVVPSHAVEFFADNGMRGFLVLGSVFLVVTGGEALYADMGHFGRRPIMIVWYAVVLPGLLCNYLGQGALLLADPSAIDNPFYRLVPSGGVLALAVLATVASVVASQALISGAFSLTHQAQQLGYLPRVRVVHTSASERGQVYVPMVNWALMVASCLLVIGFGSASALAAAYGIAVTATMAVTTVLFAVVARVRFGWSRSGVVGLTAVFIVVDLAFLGANLPKIPAGGWFAVAIGIAGFALMAVWKSGQEEATARSDAALPPLEEFVAELAASAIPRLSGTAVYLHRTPDLTPPALVTQRRLQGALHERIVVVSVETAEVPKVPRIYQAVVESLGAGVERVRVTFGFMDVPDLPRSLARVLGPERDAALYVLGPRVAVPDPSHHGLLAWRDRVFARMHRNASSASDLFHLPDDRTLSVAGQVAV